MLPPLFPPIPRPVTPDADGAAAPRGGVASVVLPCVLSELDAEVIVREAVIGRALAPADADRRARIEEPRLLSVPFWRVEVGVDGFHLGMSGASAQVGGLKVPIPTGGARHRDAVVVVCARTAFPYEARVPAWIRTVVGHPPVEIAPHELVGASPPPEGELVDADLSRADAERAAVRLLVRSVAPQNALYVKMEPTVVSTAFARLPVYWASYAYEGEAKRHTGERFFVAVSGRDGKIVAAHHPSGLRAAAARFRRLLGG